MLCQSPASHAERGWWEGGRSGRLSSSTSTWVWHPRGVTLPPLQQKLVPHAHFPAFKWDSCAQVEMLRINGSFAALPGLSSLRYSSTLEVRYTAFANMASLGSILCVETIQLQDNARLTCLAGLERVAFGSPGSSGQKHLILRWNALSSGAALAPLRNWMMCRGTLSGRGAIQVDIGDSCHLTVR